MPAPFDILVKLPDEELARLKAALSPQKVKDAHFLAVKDATKGGVTDVKREAKRVSYISPAYLNESGLISSRAPTGDPPAGRITVSKKKVPMIAYKVTASKRGGVIVRMRKDKGPLRLRHAFVATMRTGHKGVYVRGTRLPSKGPNVGKGKLTRRGIAGRLVIVEQFGPPVMDLVSDPASLAAIEAKIKVRLLNRFISKLGFLAGGGTFGGEVD